MPLQLRADAEARAHEADDVVVVHIVVAADCWGVAVISAGFGASKSARCFDVQSDFMPAPPYIIKLRLVL